jgi:hypothetical protein
MLPIPGDIAARFEASADSSVGGAGRSTRSIAKDGGCSPFYDRDPKRSRSALQSRPRSSNKLKIEICEAAQTKRQSICFPSGRDASSTPYLEHTPRSPLSAQRRGQLSLQAPLPDRSRLSASDCLAHGRLCRPLGTAPIGRARPDCARRPSLSPASEALPSD